MDSLDKQFYKISEVADILGLPASTLRFWESRFTVIKPRRNQKGTRFYTPADVEKIRMVHYLVKERGMKLEAAQEQIRKNHDGISRKVEAIDRLRRVSANLHSLIAVIDDRRRRTGSR